LRWEQVALKQGVIRLTLHDTKANEGRPIPLNQTLTSTLKPATRYVRCPWMFVNPAVLEAWEVDATQVDLRYHAVSVTHAFQWASQKAGVRNVTFDDLWHTFETNARRAGIDYFRIMAITRHKTMAGLKRHNTIDGADLRQAIRQMYPYMDTSSEMGTASNRVTPPHSSWGRRSSAGRATDS
jgi:integrase